MSYEPRFSGEPGLREGPDFRADNGLPATYPRAQPLADGTTLPPQRRMPADQRGDGDTEVDGDRLLVHLIWELALLIGTAVAAYLLLGRQPGAFSGGSLHDLLTFGAALTLLAAGTGLSVRTAAPNLAVGPLAAAAGIYFASNSARGVSGAAWTALLLALAVGLIIGILTVGLHVPAWAASLGVGFLVVIWIQQHRSPVKIIAGPDIESNAFYLFGAVIALAIVGALLGAVRPIRRAVGWFRPSGDPAWRQGVLAGAIALGGQAVCGLMAGAAGVLFALRAGTVTPSDGLALTALALGAVLLGGTSAFGRRGGILGTVLSAALLTLVLRYGEAGRPALSMYAVGGGALVIGLAVTRLVEAFGAPREEGEGSPGDGSGPDAADTAGPERSSGPSPQLGWTSTLPVRSAEETWGGTNPAGTQWGNR